MNAEPCILDVIAGMGITFPPPAVPSSIRPRVANDSPPANYVARRPRFRPDWLIDAYLATRPGTVAAVNALMTLAEGVDASECGSSGDSIARDDTAGFDVIPATSGGSPFRFGQKGKRLMIPDDPTPDEIRRRCEAIQAGWAEEEFAMRASGCSMQGRKIHRKAMASAG